MNQVLAALWPVFALIAVGYVLRKSGWLEDGFWRSAEKLSYFGLFPLLLFTKLANANLVGVAWIQVALGVLTLLGAGTILMVLVQRRLRAPGERFTSVYQGGIRFNTYVGLAACTALYDEPAMAAAAVVIGVMIPIVNVLCISAFALTADTLAPREPIVLGVLKNPLVIGCAAGIGWNLLGVGLPGLLAQPLALLVQIALPLALLLVGGAIRVDGVSADMASLTYAAAVKLVLFPLVMIAFTLAWVKDPLLASVMVLFSALPTAPSGYVLSRQLGGDAELMALIITGQTVLSALTIPLVLGLFGWLR